MTAPIPPLVCAKVRAARAVLGDTLPFDGVQDFGDSRRGFIGRLRAVLDAPDLNSAILTP